MMEPQIAVRQGQLDDLDEMMRLALAATSENAFVKPSSGLLLQHIYAALDVKMGICGVIGGEPGDKLEAAILLRIGPVWYSEEPVLEEKAIFVDHDFRAAKGGRARKLAEWAKVAATSLDLPLAIGVLSNSRTAAKIKLYERVFGAPAGVYFLFNAQTGMADADRGMI